MCLLLLLLLLFVGNDESIGGFLGYVLRKMKICHLTSRAGLLLGK
jgi:hypothetical protein